MISMKILYYNFLKNVPYLATMLLSCTVFAQVPIYAPKGSYTDFFRYYTPAGTSMPSGAQNVSRGVVYLTSAADDYPAEKFGGSAFLIQTFRNDDTVCLCTAGHVARAVLNQNYEFMGSPPYETYNFNMYMDYLGKPQNGNPGLDENISSYRTPIPISAKVVKIIEHTPGPDAQDIALFLIDKRFLPAVTNYAMLGYDLSTLYGTPTDTNRQFYQIGHPANMPQRITVAASLFGGTPLYEGMLLFGGGPPLGTGPGASGSPFVLQTMVDGTVSSSGTVHAVYDGGDNIQVPAIPEDGNKKIYYGAHPYGTELSNIANEIKAHCWKSKTEMELLQTKEYMNTVIANNNIQPFSQTQTLNQVVDLLAITAPNSFTINTQNNTVSATFLKAATCNIGSVVLPVGHPQTGKPWQINIEGKAVIITPSSTSSAFTYDAAIQSELNIASALVEPGTAAPILAKNIVPEQKGTSVQLSDFGVYPNPSANGYFNIYFPDHGPYTVHILSMEGRVLLDIPVTSSQYQLHLPDNASRGNYVMVIYRGRDPRPVYKTTLAY